MYRQSSICQDVDSARRGRTTWRERPLGSWPGCVFRPGHRASQVGGDHRSLAGVPNQNRVRLGKCHERRHRRRARSDDVLAIVACHDHQLEPAVLTVGSGAPIRVQDFDPTRLFARSRHEPHSRDFGVSPTLTTKDGAFMEPRGCNGLQPVANRSAAKAAEISQNRCRGLRPVAETSAW